MTDDAVKATRRYDSPVRRERSAETRERIVDAGADLVRELGSWDWAGLTVREVATRAGVHERTVHRHFAAERDLRAAVLQRLIEEAGVTVEGLRLDQVPEQVRQLFGYLAGFSNAPRREPDAVFAELDRRRKAALLDTVAEAGATLSEAERRLVAALVDVLWGVPTYNRLTGDWDLDADAAARGVGWLVRLLVDAVAAGRGPGSAHHDR
ncbi:MAG TPA: TetR/AcrR family transcriptional regulator [Mycobacteriales bacterium]|nr:TetR/AcrR family transcriptional regulator [Mycobacteriales bacterium]